MNRRHDQWATRLAVAVAVTAITLALMIAWGVR